MHIYLFIFNSFLSSGTENDAAESKAMPNTTEQNDVLEPTTSPSEDLPQPPKPSLAAPVDLAMSSKAGVEPPVVLRDPGTETSESAHVNSDPISVDELKSNNKLLSDEEDNPLKPTFLPTKATEEDVAIVNEDREAESHDHESESETALPTVATPTAAMPTEAVNPTQASDENVNTVEAPKKEDDNKEYEDDDHVVAKPTVARPTAAVTPTNPTESHDVEAAPTESASSSIPDSVQLDKTVEESTSGKKTDSSNKVPNMDQADELQDNFLEVKKAKDQLEEPAESDMKDEQSTPDKKVHGFPGLEMLPVPHENAGGRNDVPRAKSNKKAASPKSVKSKVVTATSSKREDMGLGETKDDSFSLDSPESKGVTLDLEALNEKPAQEETSNAAPVLETSLGKSSEHHDTLSSAIAQAEKEADSNIGHPIEIPGAETESHGGFDNSSPSDSLGEKASPQDLLLPKEQQNSEHDDVPSSFSEKFDTSPMRFRRPIKHICPPCRK